MSTEEKINIDGKTYYIKDLSENALNQIENIKFVDDQLQKLSSELAVADTARIGYANALQAELEKIT
jgi:hypothetical protein